MTPSRLRGPDAQRLASIAGLYPILDDSFLPAETAARGRRLSSLARGLAGAGVTVLQYRNKLGSDAQVLAETATLRAAAPPGLRLILNDRAHLAAAANFDGVHLGQTDVAVAEARALLGPYALIGLSTHNEAQLVAGDRTSADYLAIGPIFATKTKLNPDPVVGLDGLRRARALTPKPLVAIGGITLENAAAVRAAGADAVAVISALFARKPAEGDSEGESTMKIAEDFLAVFR